MAHISISDANVRFHIRGPNNGSAMVGQGSSITCSIDAPEADDTFVMYIDGTPFSELSPECPWSKAGFNRSTFDWENGTISTDIVGFVDEFTSGHNGTEINCTSWKYNGHVAMEIDLQPDNSTDNSTGRNNQSQKMNYF